MSTGSRREVLAVLAGGLTTLSGCSILDSADDDTPGDGQPFAVAESALYTHRQGAIHVWE